MAPQRVSPLCSKPLDMSYMTIAGFLVGLRSTLAVQPVNVACDWVVYFLTRLFQIVRDGLRLYYLVSSC